MRLSLTLLFKKLPNGHIFRGKHRLEPKIRYWMTRELVKDIQREEENMLILRHHYLSKEQVRGYAYDLGKVDAFIRQKVDERYSKSWPADVTLESRLGELRRMDSWDK